MSDPNVTRTQMLDTVATATEVLPSPRTRDEHGRFLPSNPGPAFKHGLRSELLRSGKLFESEQRLVEKRDRIRNGELTDIRTAYANTFVALEAIASGFAADIALNGPLSGKGHTRTSVNRLVEMVSTLLRVGTQLGYVPPTPSTEPSTPRLDALLSGLTDDELSTVKAIFDRSAERKANGEQPDALPTTSDPAPVEPFTIELPSETSE